MGAAKALWDPFTADDKKPSRRILIFIYRSIPIEHIKRQKVISAQLSFRGTRLLGDSFDIEDKKEFFNCNIFSLNFIQDYRRYKKFEGVWSKFHRVKAQSK